MAKPRSTRSGIITHLIDNNSATNAASPPVNKHCKLLDCFACCSNTGFYLPARVVTNKDYYKFINEGETRASKPEEWVLSAKAAEVWEELKKASS